MRTASAGVPKGGRQVKAWHRWGQSVGVAMVAAAAVVIAGCGGANSNNNTSTQVNRSGTITIWHGYEGTYLDTKKAILDQYSKQYPNVTINLVHKPNLTDAVTAEGGPRPSA